MAVGSEGCAAVAGNIHRLEGEVGHSQKVLTSLSIHNAGRTTGILYFISYRCKSFTGSTSKFFLIQIKTFKK